jgi:hypothetical protein
MNIIRNFLARDIELIPDGNKLIARGHLNDDDRELLRENKQKILEILSQNACLGCRASGYWDYGKHTGKLLCFHHSVYECRSGRPTPCDEVVQCPKLGV